MLTALNLLPADDYCRVAQGCHARPDALPAAAADTAVLHASNGTCAPAFDTDLPAAYAPKLPRAAVGRGLHARDTRRRVAQTCYETAIAATQ